MLKRAIEIIADLTELDYLKDYLNMSPAAKGRDLAANFGQDFLQYLFSAGEEELAALVSAEIEKNEFLDFSFLETLPDKAFEGFLGNLPSDISDDPQSPTYLFMDFIRDVANEWLIHGTNDAESIEANGFTRGVWDLASLGLTTQLVDKVKTGGFNFAFYATSFHEKEVLAYGKEAVVFRASGIEVDHYGDQQRQIIFLGNTATDIHSINYSSGIYYVMINDVEFEGTLKECADWIMENA
jgi:hypothetical protein